MKGITQEDTRPQLLCLLLRFPRRGTARQQISPVTLGIRVGNLLNKKLSNDPLCEYDKNSRRKRNSPSKRKK